MRNLLHISIIFPIFVMLSYIIGARVPDIEGIFFALEHKDTALPCHGYNGYGSPDEGLSKGRGGIPFLLPPQILNAMLKNSSGDDVALASEIWKDIKGYEGLYQVSSLGRVKSMGRLVCRPGKLPHFKRPVILRGVNRSGYFYVHLSRGGVTWQCAIHRLVAAAFLTHLPDRNEVNHKDGNKRNNVIDNLEWCNRSENITHAIRMGLKIQPVYRGIDNKNSKLTEDNVRQMRTMYYVRGMQIKKIAQAFSVDPKTTRCALLYKTWKHVDPIM